ncbi:MAG: hypothetical protein ABI967_01805, partial [bacterium]
MTEMSSRKKSSRTSFALVAASLLFTAYCLLPNGYRQLTTDYPLLTTASASDPGNGDWPMWGGTPDR